MPLDGIQVSIATMRIDVRVDDPSMEDLLERRFKGYTVSDVRNGAHPTPKSTST